jgi:hypothetical protein
MQADAIAREKGGKKEGKKEKQESAAAGGGAAGVGVAGVGVGGVGVGSVRHSHTDTGYLWGNENATLECALRLVSAVASLGWQKQAFFFSLFFPRRFECALRLASLGWHGKGRRFFFLFFSRFFFRRLSAL